MSEQVIVEIDETGTPTIEVKGVKGKACKSLTADLEKALGKVSSVTETPEANQRASHGRTVNQR